MKHSVNKKGCSCSVESLAPSLAKKTEDGQPLSGRRGDVWASPEPGKAGTGRGAGAARWGGYRSYAFGEVGLVRINDCDVLRMRRRDSVAWCTHPPLAQNARSGAPGTYNLHRSAPFLRALVGLSAPSLLGRLEPTRWS